MDAFLEIYDRYFDDLYRYVLFRVGNRWDADDLVSDIFRKVLEYSCKNGGRSRNMTGPGYLRSHIIGLSIIIVARRRRLTALIWNEAATNILRRCSRRRQFRTNA
ncbi:hypothetical protein RE628_01540 [Paenibacillus sp. D2_2]|uniref:RNA polymerase sigma factor n=1 Tax=Paenibacillus sp. D2_2 TaxID=3073092 RepID=UPI002814CFD6|nr:hypothetical protein [Paenibacillus sp. D2_2]WMT41300.1 hypothetical protein RE628_01540 [Paenibacillus sp. D2_2]